jgi:outer membrane protein, multidrug efflux system
MAMDGTRRRSILLPLVLLASAGCASTGGVGAVTRPIETPAWQTPAHGVVAGTTDQDLSRWWDRLADSTLTGLIDRALAESPDVHVAQGRLRQARAQRAQAAAELWPAVTASGSASGRQSGNRVFAADGTSTVVNNVTGSYGASIDASWEPDLFGGTRKGVDAETADLRATEADLYGTHVSLAAEVARNYGDLRTQQARLDIARRNEASQAETLELTGFRAQAGLVSGVEVEQARANLEQTRAQIPSLESNIAQATFRLATLAGAEPALLTTALSQPGPLPAVPAEVAIGIPADTLRQRPDIRAAEQRIVAETERLAQAGVRRYPQFSLSGTVGVEVLTGAITGGASVITSLASKVVQTLFDRGRIRQQIEIQSAVQEQAVASYEATVLAALEEVESALVALEKSRQRLASLTAAAEAASNAALLARSQYAAGLADFQTVLSTERTVLTVQESVAVTEGDRVTALIQLYKALGGGWSPRPPHPPSRGRRHHDHHTDPDTRRHRGRPRTPDPEGMAAAIQALRGVDFTIRDGEFVAITGPSGSGKSTVMNILGCLDTPTSGSYLFNGVPVERLLRNQRALLRRHFFGFVFQGFNLLARSDERPTRRRVLDRVAPAASHLRAVRRP